MDDDIHAAGGDPQPFQVAHVAEQEPQAAIVDGEGQLALLELVAAEGADAP